MENERLLTRAEAGITNQLGAHDSILSRARDETLDVGVRDVLDLVEGRVELLVVDSGLVAVVRVLVDSEVEVVTSPSVFSCSVVSTRHFRYMPCIPS